MSDTARMPIQFGTRYAEHISGPLTQETVENLYLEKAPENSKFQYVLIGTPGLLSFGSYGNGPIRGLHVVGSYLFVVSGNNLYVVEQSGAGQLLGNVEGAGRVQFADNGTYVWIATGGILYAADTSSVIQVANGTGIVDVAYQDGFLMGVDGKSQDMVISAVDGITISALDFTTVDTLPGLAVGIISDHREPLIFCEDRVEAFYNTGAAAFPFSRTQVVERGCIARASIAKHRNMVFWVGDDLQPYGMAGYDPQPIGDPTIVRLIEAETSPQTIEGYTYQQSGHTFYVLSMQDITVAYDIDTGLWHRRKSDGIKRWRAQGHVWARRWRKHLVGDYDTGDIYELSTTTYTENGNVLRRRAAGAPVFNSGRRFIIDEFTLDIDAGVGLVTGQGSDPQAMLDWTSDGGKTWSNELWRSFGKIGEYNVEPTWYALGAHRQWTPRVTISDPVPVRINGAYVRQEPLAV